MRTPPKQQRTIQKVLAAMLVLCLISADIFCQQLALKKYTVASGLTSNYIFDLFQDMDGFIWIATDHGVSRFDGKTFTNFTKTDGLGANYVYKIFQSSDGTIWFGTFNGGVTSFDNNSFKTVDEGDGLLNNIVSDIVEDNYGRMYFMTEKGLSIYKDSIITSTDLEIVKGGGIYFHPSGKIFFNGHSKFYLLTPNEKNVFVPQEIKLTSEQREVFSLNKSWAFPFLRKNNTLLYPGRTKCLEINITNNGDIKSINIINKTYYALFEDQFGWLWAAERNGVTIISDDTTRVLSKKDGLDPDYIEAILEDKEGNIWLGTFGGGLYKFKGDHLKYFTKNDGLSSNIVTSLCEDSQNNVYVGTTNGLSLIKNNNSVIKVKPKVIFGEIQKIAIDNKNNLYYGTFNSIRGPFKLNNFNSSFSTWSTKTGISSIYFDNKNKIWAGSYGEGLFHIKENNLVAFENKRNPTPYIIEDIVKGNDSFWLLTGESGAIKIKDNSFRIFAEEHNLPSNAVSSLLEEENGDIWFGTDNGIAKYHDDEVTIYCTNEQLIGNYTLGIFKYRNKIFFVTEKAIHFNKNGKPATYLGSSILPKKDVGIQNFLFSQKTGILWLGTNDGIIRLDLDEVEKRRKRFANIAPNIVITSVYSDTSKLYNYSSIKNLFPIKKGELNLSQNTLSFNFTGISFIGELPVHYQFRLDGEENHWSEITTLNEITYRNLSSGEYTFNVQSINSLGIKSDNIAKYSFIITPPYWEKLWFIISTILLGISILVLFVYFVSTRVMRKNIKQLKQKQALQEVKIKTRERIAEELHDDVASTLSSINLFAESLNTKLKNEPQKKEQYLSRLKSLTRDAQSTMEEVVWELSPHHDTIQDLVLRISDFSTELCYDNNMKCTLNAVEIKDNFHISEEIRKTFYLILKEVLNNILKHSEATEVIIKIEIDGDYFVLTISDNGKGLSKSIPQNISVGGHGLNNMRSRANRIEASLNINSNNGSGTEIILKKQIAQMRY